MKSKTWLFIISIFSFLTALSVSGYVQQKSGNPLEHGFNAIIDFENLRAEDIAQKADNVIAESRMEFEKIYEIPKDKRIFDNTLLPLDNYYERSNTASGIINLMASIIVIICLS